MQLELKIIITTNVDKGIKLKQFQIFLVLIKKKKILKSNLQHCINVWHFYMISPVFLKLKI